MFDGLQILSNTTKHDQTRSNTIKQHQTRCPNGKMFGYQTTFDGVWSPNIPRLSRPLMQTDEQAWYACPHQTFLIRGCPNEQNIAHQTREQKKWSNVWWPSNFIKHGQTRSITIKQHQTRWPNGKMFGHQTMFDGVWSPNISRLSRP